MKLNRTRVLLGIGGLGVVAALAGGAGIAFAATGANGGDSGTTVPCVTAAGGQVSAMPDRGWGQGAPMTAAASYLGLSPSDLHSRLVTGKSLADIATAQGKSVSGLEDAMIAAVTADLNANSSLTAEQRATMLAQVKAHVEDMVNDTHAAGSGFGWMGGGMGGMGR